ncbi:phosphoribosylpyrophosphate synthetase [Haloflavibacter putidus]|uniref:Phosphoribosylpyrophosphate synthetase n=1 Tax=Haloflavibacter putidus TaxID=2576776 RepID=A0A507ZPZ1_9FLAO|nr:phosphoribosylpyrophosphate synthetase [Haloflavibacter putidus]TQD39389.1 phosphoribosylpyrophosphate synthetase [Haloflavibacter putidus]
MKNYGTLSEAIEKLKNEGYTKDFNLIDEYLEDKEEKKRYTADEFEVDRVFRFEGMSNPADNSVLYAITTSNGSKGLLTDAYGAYSGQISRTILKKLQRDTQ